MRLNARFRDEQRSPIPGMDIVQDVVKRTEPGMIHLDPGPAIDPLVVRVVVYPNNVKVLRFPAQLRPQPSGDVVPDLELAVGVVPRGDPIFTAVRLGMNGDGGFLVSLGTHSPA